MNPDSEKETSGDTDLDRYRTAVARIHCLRWREMGPSRWSVDCACGLWTWGRYIRKPRLGRDPGVAVKEEKTVRKKPSFQMRRMLEAHRFHAAQHRTEIATFNREQWPWPEDL